MKNKIFLGALIVAILSLMLYKVNTNNMENKKLIIYGNENTQKISDDNFSKSNTSTRASIGKLEVKNGNKTLNKAIVKQLGEVSDPVQINVFDISNNKQLAKVENTNQAMNVSNSLKLFVGIAFEKFEGNKEKAYVIKQSDIKEKDSVLQVGTGYSYTYLRQLMLKQNNNDAANILLKLIGRDKVKQIAGSFGAKSTTVTGKFGSKDVGKTTASDLIITLKKLYQGKVLGREKDNLILQEIASYPNKGLATKVPGISYHIADDNSSVSLIETSGNVYVMSVVSGTNLDMSALGEKINNSIINK